MYGVNHSSTHETYEDYIRLVREFLVILSSTVYSKALESESDAPRGR